jgi:hypothetical protein
MRLAVSNSIPGDHVNHFYSKSERKKERKKGKKRQHTSIAFEALANIQRSGIRESW